MIAYTPRPKSVLALFRELLNTFIHSSGDYPLLRQTHELFPAEPVERNFTLLIPIIARIILDLLTNQNKIEYAIGHVIMSMLILEAVRRQAASPSEIDGGGKRIPLSRRLLQAVSCLHRKGGLRVLFNVFGTSCAYWTTHSSLTTILSSLVLHNKTLRPFAHILSSVLLAGAHFSWTAHTILPHDQYPSPVSHMSRLLRDSRSRQLWKVLAIPALIHSSAEVLMSYIPAMVEHFIGVPQESLTLATKSNIILSDILVSVFMLACHVLLLFPSYIVLIAVEASLLPPSCETIVFESSRQRGLRIGEIFSRVEVPLQMLTASRMVGVGMLLWCLELHVKMCLFLLGVAAVAHFAARGLL
ncbi:hypothetical protein BO70DRAFT_389268 [Aspergillus heteromorphus CBS 117.55]|uniref:Uncharacterized protein n=1 Tax=Aspergillus heteromorphus CBS 117.55 TaxID=1448321 RepID=A0A317VF11_9EURO|nr:uncharacterized protein BO70DRAFT_389268 [Aspergillus heteromorphus CBS 117.55]PWY72956.1 hypothetical protein BO70DRAFT_389268 [Aspergillus heteromorphus CBS 117.55]